MNQVYLGDSVYASNDGFHIVLTADRNIIYLDDNVVGALLKYIEHEHGVQIQVKKLPVHQQGAGGEAERST